MFRLADCACVLDSCDIERKEAVDVVQFSRSQAFLRLDDLDRGGDTRGEAILRLLEGAKRQLAVAVRNLQLLRGDLKIQDGRPDIVFDRSLFVVEFRRALRDGRLRLLDL